MKPADALADLLCRVAAAGGAAAWLSERELADWPALAVAQLKAAGLLVKGPPADTVTCPGCEEDCTMPVEVAITAGGAACAFVLCDKRDDVGRVAVATDLLEQWACSPERVADALARMLGTRRTNGDAAGRRWDVGVLKGTKHSAHVVLGIEDTLQLSIAGHSLPVADVLELGDRCLILERRALLRCVDAPMAAAEITDRNRPLRKRGSAGDSELRHTELELGSPEWRSQTARTAANARHDRPGGSRDKQRQMQEIWASGKYSSRDLCAEQECAALGMSFSAARRALINTPDP